jgi:hypothetical protein
MYCNFDKLQFLFSQTFRLCSNYPTFTDVKSANQECSQWSKYLREAVELYGQSKADSNAKLFYHGISSELLFESTIARFASPTSTSTKLSVAVNFASEDGLILVLAKYGLDVCSFNCSWLSDFAGEEERLFVGGYQPLVITNILVMSCKTRLTLSIMAINILLMIVEARFKPGIIPDTDQEMNVLRQKLDQLIQTKFDDNNNSDKYIDRLFAHICDNWNSEIRISLSHLNAKFAQIAPIFYRDMQCFHFGLLFVLFPQCPRISIDDGFVLSEKAIEQLFQQLSVSDNSNLVEIEIHAPNEAQMSIGQVLTDYQPQLELICWMIRENNNEEQHHPSLLLQRNLSVSVNGDAELYGAGTSSKGKSTKPGTGTGTATATTKSTTDGDEDYGDV